MNVLRATRGHRTIERHRDSDGTENASCKCGARFSHNGRFLANKLLAWERGHAKPKRQETT